MTWLDWLIVAAVLGYCGFLLLRKPRGGCCGDCSRCSGCKTNKK